MSTWRGAAGDASGATARARQATAKRAAARTVAAHGGQRSGAGLSGGRSTTAAWCRDARSPPGGAWPPRRGPDPHAAPAARARWRGCAPPRSAGRFPRVRRSAWPRRPWRRCPARAGPAPRPGPPGPRPPRAAAAGWRRDRARAPPDLRRLLGRLPHCARGRVLEQDAPRAEILADRIRSAEVLAPARLVALGDRGRDLRLAHPGAGGPSGAQRGQEVRRFPAEDAEDG